jgi:hypothetical protein
VTTNGTVLNLCLAFQSHGHGWADREYMRSTIRVFFCSCWLLHWRMRLATIVHAVPWCPRHALCCLTRHHPALVLAFTVHLLSQQCSVSWQDFIRLHQLHLRQMHLKHTCSATAKPRNWMCTTPPAPEPPWSATRTPAVSPIPLVPAPARSSRRGPTERGNQMHSEQGQDFCHRPCSAYTKP